MELSHDLSLDIRDGKGLIDKGTSGEITGFKKLKDSSHTLLQNLFW